tara:strand:- start:1263 stop:2102 length:840 start_codon:yes stop_codon:yes gene_type:complete
MKINFLLKINRFLIEFLFPPKIYELLINLLDRTYLFFLKKNKLDLSSLTSMRDEVYILGNGPSLKDNDLSFLKEKDFIAMNFFIKHELANKLNPIFYVMGDAVVNKDTNPKEFYTAKANTIEIVKNVKSKIFLHTKKRIWNSLFSKKNNIFYFKVLFSRLDQFMGNNFNFEKAIPRPNNSVQLAIMLAINLGYKEIILLGVDEDQLINRTHFNNHFYKMSEKDIALESSEMSYYERLKKKSITFAGFKKLKIISNKKNIKIYNSNRLSYLDIFEFKELI